MTMLATVLEVQCGNLKVRDHGNRQEVLVHTSHACRFQVGDRVKITYSGAMTMSIPPQISAHRIIRLPHCREC